MKLQNHMEKDCKIKIRKLLLKVVKGDISSAELLFWIMFGTDDYTEDLDEQRSRLFWENTTKTTKHFRRKI